MKRAKEARIKLPEAEGYFIQFLFCESRALLGQEYRRLYDALFDAYKDVYKAGRDAQVDLFTINKKFKEML